MSERFFDYWRIDVFTDTPLTGNPLAVFPRATGLSPAEMLGIAREMNISETTFIFPASNPSANYRNRIFTPGGEIAFAGHPSIGTAFVAAQEGLVPQIAATGIQSLQVPIRSLEVVKGLDPDLRDLRKVLSKYGEKVVCYAFALEAVAPDAAVHARGFAPDLGIEDPATGSAAGACGAYLAGHGKLPAPTFIVEQGMEIHHASRIEVSVETEDGKPKVIRVGGQVAPLIRGTLRLP